jgi:hypothetical protein
VHWLAVIAAIALFRAYVPLDFFSLSAQPASD